MNKNSKIYVAGHNGLVGKAVMRKLLKEGYEYVPYVSHEKLIEDNKPDYYLALRKSQKTIKTKKENIVFWLEFFLEILLKQSREAVDLLLNESIENILTRKQLMVWEYLESVDEASPLKISQETKVLLPTVRQTLNKLIKLKRVSRSGQGRGVVYSKIR